MSRAAHGPLLADVADATASGALCAAGLAAAYAPELLHGAHSPVEISRLVIRRWIEHGSPTPARWADPVSRMGSRAGTARCVVRGVPAAADGRDAGLPTPARARPPPDADRLRRMAGQLAAEAGTIVPLPNAPGVPRPRRFPHWIRVLAGGAGGPRPVRRPAPRPARGHHRVAAPPPHQTIRAHHADHRRNMVVYSCDHPNLQQAPRARNVTYFIHALSSSPMIAGLLRALGGDNSQARSYRVLRFRHPSAFRTRDLDKVMTQSVYQEDGGHLWQFD